jgi:DNA repair exonuclease SbcCD ATPase subunit
MKGKQKIKSNEQEQIDNTEDTRVDASTRQEPGAGASAETENADNAPARSGDNAGGDGTQQQEQPVPYWRFSQVNEAKNEAEAKHKEAEAELEKYRKAEAQREEDEQKERGEYEQIIAKRDKKIAELEPLAQRAEALETVVKELLEAELAEVPEEFRDLFPTGEPVESLRKLKEKKAAGLFGPRQAPDLNAGEHGGGKKPKPQASEQPRTRQRF